MASPMMEVVARILSASSHYAVLELADALAPPAAVRRKYKELAIRVHPDKNREDGAADAFKRLSEAYECLVDEHSQRAYLQTRSAQGQRVKRKPPPPATPPPNRAPPYFPKKQRGKKRPPPPPPPPPSAPPPRRWRTPEEVWAQFQREEEEQARREFQARGFERDYDATDRKKRRREATTASRRQEPHQEEQTGSDETELPLGVESRAKGWTDWQQSRAQAEQPSALSSTTEVTAACCLLCRRKFPTSAALARHEQLSDLHRDNLARQAQSARVDHQ